jgi:hypothetical protein
MNFPVLTQRSVDKLRKLTADGVNILDMPFEALVEDYSLLLLDLSIEIDTSVELQLPTGIKQEENRDKENCLALAKALPNLTDIQATDERLWVTLGLREYRSYALARWPLPTSDSKNPRNHINNHWFASNVRARMRDHAISRLWWYQRLCARIEGRDLEPTLEELFFNSDYRSSMLERNTSSSISAVVGTILEITEENKARGVVFNREKFRAFMKSVDLLAGRSRMAVLSKQQLKERLALLYDEAYK